MVRSASLLEIIIAFRECTVEFILHRSSYNSVASLTHLEERDDLSASIDEAAKTTMMVSHYN